MAIVFLLNRLIFRVVDFFHHWYVDGSRSFFNGFLSVLSYLDKIFAVRITLHFFFAPLYGDYSLIGRTLGIIFRSLRILLGLAVYILIGFVFSFFYLVWLLIPAFIIYSIFLGKA